MPDYSILTLLCKELGITLSELMNGEEEKSIHMYDDEQVIEMMEKMQNLKNNKIMIISFILIIIGMLMLVFSQLFKGSDIQEFLSGILLGISIPEVLIGVFLLTYWLAHRNR